MLNLKLGLAALGMEVSAWTTVALLHERSDAALAGYLLLHALACVLLSLTLLPLLRQRQGRPGWTLLLIMACSYAIPVAGFVGVVVAFVFLTLYRRPRRRDDFEMLESPEFDQHEKRRNSFRHIGMRSFLTNTRAPLHARMRAMSALQYVGGRTATPLLRTAMGDASEDLRLLAYGMLDNLEKRINHAIDQELQTWHGAQAAGDEVQSMDSARQLADLYWELVYQALVQGDLRDHACTQALHYCEYVLARQPDNAALVLRKGCLLHAQGRGAQAQAAYAHARTLGLPATRVLPYEAELCFAQRDFPRTRALMSALDQWGALPRLRPVINYWKGQ